MCEAPAPREDVGTSVVLINATCSEPAPIETEDATTIEGRDDDACNVKYVEARGHDDVRTCCGVAPNTMLDS